MTRCRQFVLLATYNEWMNGNIYAAADRLSPADLHAERGAFFGSVFGTLNHVVAADTIWLTRFARHPAKHSALAPMSLREMPKAIDQRMAADLAGLTTLRRELDAAIQRWSAELREDDLDHVLEYANTKGVVGHRRFGDLILHFFNHQTHHRGQATTLLHQMGIDVGVTDLFALIPDLTPAAE